PALEIDRRNDLIAPVCRHSVVRPRTDLTKLKSEKLQNDVGTGPFRGRHNALDPRRKALSVYQHVADPHP
ncbi:hypothetical protein, partial [Mesorhizobium sp.]|uniref:hypothetical protein n=1 Tax=Mesorhizobium sp. TaxID=1871066 RepID=UPI00257DC4D1